MGTQLGKVPANELELNEYLHQLYVLAKQNYDENVESNFTGLLEIIQSEANILTSIHKIKNNKGSQTPGVDGKIIDDCLGMKYDVLIEYIQNKFRNYKPNRVRRVMIPKPGKNELRPLGIPTISDRIVQECVRNVLEPIAEGQFFKHSYGFRPMRSADMAVARIKQIQFTAKCHWVVEGDIKGFFDNINHNVMIKSLWQIGIRDKRVLCIIKQMLRAGIMNECRISDLGTPQGGIISPLLANIYLNRFDRYITNNFECKKLRKTFARDDSRISAMRNHSNIRTAYYVRYADDWVILTDSRESAEKLKAKAKSYLANNLKLELSEEKTLITNCTSKPIKFLGVNIKLVKINGRYTNTVSPDPKRFREKIMEIQREIKALRKINIADKERLVQNIIRVNAIIVGISNYYAMCDKINVYMLKYSNTTKYMGYKALKRHGAKWIPANQVANLKGRHFGHTAKIPAIKYKGMYIGITDLLFTVWENPRLKNPNETPYTTEGREIYNKRMRSKGVRARMDEVNTSEHALELRISKNPMYDFEYFMNRAYIYGRDKGKCRICNGFVEPREMHAHHVRPKAPKNLRNKAKNLITTHIYCHKLIHNNELVEELSVKTRKNLDKYRNLLNIN